MKEIGLGWDPNKVVKIPNTRDARLKLLKTAHGFTEEDTSNEKPNTKEIRRPKSYVMEQMEADANALRESKFRYVHVHRILFSLLLVGLVHQFNILLTFSDCPKESLRCSVQ